MWTPSALGRRTTVDTSPLVWHGVTVLSSLLLLVFVWVIDSRFFYRGDTQDQYIPAYRDIGRRLLDGEWLPIIDPALGQSGNYALDVQYGLFEPTHWLVAVGVTLTDNAELAAWAWSSAYLLILAGGVCAVALKLGAQGWWAAAGGFAAAFSGFVLFWLAPSWVLGLMSLAWVPWWWWTVLTRRTRASSLLATAVLAFLITAGGWPATWFIWAAVGLGVALEAAVTATSRLHGLRALLPAALASAGGAVAGVVSVLPLLRAVDSTHKETEAFNDGFLVPNLGDVLAFAAPGLLGDIRSFGGYSVGAPYFFGVWFAVVVAWLLPWGRDLLRRPGVISAGTAIIVSVLLTQAASELGPFRWPIRYLPGFHLALAVATAVLASGELRMSRRRAAGIAWTVAALVLLMFFRLPDDSAWLVSGVALAAAAAVLLRAMTRHGRQVAGAAALVTTMVLTGGVIEAFRDSGIPDEGYPAHPTAGRIRLDAVPSLALYPPEGDEGSWYRQGVGVGFTRLTAQVRSQPGYSSVSQGAWRERFCMSPSDGSTCPLAAGMLFAREQVTGLRWIDLLGYQQVAVHHGSHLRLWSDVMTEAWVRRLRTDDFVLFERVAPAPTAIGRVTAVVGDATVRAGDIGRQTQRYQVRSADGARLVFRDLYWPGYVATLDGEPLVVEAVADTLVSVRLPPGADGTLELTYDVLPTALWAGTVGAGLLLWLLAVAMAVRRRTR